MEFILHFLGSVLTNTLLTAFVFVIFALVYPLFSTKGFGNLLVGTGLAIAIFIFIMGIWGLIVGLISGLIISSFNAGVRVNAVLGFAVYIVSYLILYIKSGNSNSGKFAVTFCPAVLSALSCASTSYIFINSPTS